MGKNEAGDLLTTIALLFGASNCITLSRGTSEWRTLTVFGLVDGRLVLVCTFSVSECKGQSQRLSLAFCMIDLQRRQSQGLNVLVWIGGGTKLMRWLREKILLDHW